MELHDENFITNYLVYYYVCDSNSIDLDEKETLSGWTRGEDVEGLEVRSGVGSKGHNYKQRS